MSLGIDERITGDLRQTHHWGTQALRQFFPLQGFYLPLLVTLDRCSVRARLSAPGPAHRVTGANPPLVGATGFDPQRYLAISALRLPMDTGANLQGGPNLVFGRRPS